MRWYLLLALGMAILTACASEDHSYGVTAELHGDPSIERTWVEPGIRKIAVRSSGEDYTLFNAQGVRVGTDGRVYVLDGGDFTIKAFTPEGTYVATYGEGKGSAPAQLQSFSDVRVWRDSVHVVDSRGRKVAVFAKDGDFGRAVQYEKPISEIAWGGNTKYVQRGLGVVSSVFLSIIPSSGEALDVSLPLSRDAHPIVFDGSLYATEKQAVFVPYYLPVLLTYLPDDTSGTAYPTPSYGDVPFQKASQQGGGVRRTVTPPQHSVHMSETFIGGVLTVRQNSVVAGDSLAFDLYDAREGMDYMHSSRFSLPYDYHHAQYAYATGLLVTHRDTSIQFYEVDSPTK